LKTEKHNTTKLLKQAILSKRIYTILISNTNKKTITMSTNAAPIKYAQRKDSIYLTIALAGPYKVLNNNTVRCNDVSRLLVDLNWRVASRRVMVWCGVILESVKCSNIVSYLQHVPIFLLLYEYKILFIMSHDEFRFYFYFSLSISLSRLHFFLFFH
jgi:hypothetical protein